MDNLSDDDYQNILNRLKDTNSTDLNMPEVKNYKKIGELHEQMKPHERQIALLINKIMAEEHHAFEVRKAFDEMGKWDLELIFNDRKEEKRLLKIEVECGVKQHYWINKVPDENKWTRGLSVLGRKITNYSSGELSIPYDIYIKSNLACTSLFAIDAQWLMKVVKNGLVKKKHSNHNLGFQTNNDFYGVPHSLAKVEKDFVCICNDSNFEDLKHLIKRIYTRNHPTWTT